MWTPYETITASLLLLAEAARLREERDGWMRASDEAKLSWV